MNTNKLIASLAQNTAPLSHLSFGRVFAELATITCLSLLTITLLYGIRADISIQLSNEIYNFELFANSLLLIASAYTAVSLAYPDRITNKSTSFLLLGLALYGVSIIFKLLENTEFSGEHIHIHSIECLICILSFAIIPAIFITWRLRKLATVKPALLGAVCLLMATSVGTLGVLIVESEVVSTGLILWHYLPIFALSFLGYLLGRKIFSW